MSVNSYAKEICMKKEFIIPKIDLINILASDIIATSSPWAGGNITLPIIPFADDDPIA